MTSVYDEPALKALLGPAIRALPRGGQTAMARAVGVEPQTVNKWAKEQTCPDPVRWPAIERYLEWEEGTIAEEVIPLFTAATTAAIVVELTGVVAKLTERVADLEKRIAPQASRSGGSTKPSLGPTG